MTTYDGRRRDYPCPTCGYYGIGCICHETEEAPAAPSKLIVLLPEHSPITSEEQEEKFHNAPAYDNLASEDRHYLMSAIRLFFADKGNTIDMAALNRYLQIQSIERAFNQLNKEIDEIG